jgi:hypothetical protein
MRQLRDFAYERYVRAMRGRIDHPYLGHLTLTHCVPHINMFWWRSHVAFPPTGGSITLELRSPSTGPTVTQTVAYRALVSRYEKVLAAGVERRFIPHDAELEQVVLYKHGHCDLLFRSQYGEHLAYLNERLEFLTPEEASMS